MKQDKIYHSPESCELEMQSCRVLCESKETLTLDGGFTLENYDTENTDSYGWN